MRGVERLADHDVVFALAALAQDPISLEHLADALAEHDRGPVSASIVTPRPAM